MNCEVCECEGAEIYHWERGLQKKRTFYLCDGCRAEVDKAIDNALEKARKAMTTDFNIEYRKIKDKIKQDKMQLKMIV